MEQFQTKETDKTWKSVNYKFVNSKVKDKTWKVLMKSLWTSVLMAFCATTYLDLKIGPWLSYNFFCNVWTRVLPMIVRKP
jgi:hypothetical protein